MKVTVLVLSLIALGKSAVVVNGPFSKHIEDFIGVILAESGLELERLLSQHAENKEFAMATMYFKTTEFRDVIYQIESLPEVRTAINYLEKNNLHVLHYIDNINEIIDNNNEDWRKYRDKQSRPSVINTFIRESISLLPKNKLRDLYEQKKNEDDGFKVVAKSFKSKEWDEILNALLTNETLNKNAQTLSENAFDVHLLSDLIKAIFGQN